jgi:hypothetical protein
VLTARPVPEIASLTELQILTKAITRVFGLCLSPGILKSRKHNVSSFENARRWAKSENPVILSIRHNRQNLSDRDLCF